MQVRNLALNTRESYLQQVSLFARHFNDLLGISGSKLAAVAKNKQRPTSSCRASPRFSCN